MVTLVASSQKLGLTEGLSFVLPWAFFLGGIAQLITGILDSKRNNIFGTAVFGAYGLFWFAIGMSWLIQLGVFGKELAATVDPKQLGFAFIGYLIFSLFMTIGSMEINKFLFITFIFIDFLFIGLALTTFGIAPEFTHMLAAYSELIVSLLSFYGAGSSVLNGLFGRVVLPVGKPFGIFIKEATPKSRSNESKVA